MTYRDGEYIAMRGSDTPEQRDSAYEQLVAQGCRTVRFATLDDGRLQSHGYVNRFACEKCGQEATRFVGKWCEDCAG